MALILRVAAFVLVAGGAQRSHLGDGNDVDDVVEFQRSAGSRRNQPARSLESGQPRSRETGKPAPNQSNAERADAQDKRRLVPATVTSTWAELSFAIRRKTGIATWVTYPCF